MAIRCDPAGLIFKLCFDGLEEFGESAVGHLMLRQHAAMGGGVHGDGPMREWRSQQCGG